MKYTSRIFSPDHTWMAQNRIRYYLLNKYIFTFSLCGHTLFTPVFYLLNTDVPLFNNTICIAADLICIYLNSRWRLKTATTVYAAAVMLHTFFCNIYFGWEAGFIFYYFSITIYIFLTRIYATFKSLMFSMVIVLFISQYIFLELNPPVFPATIIPLWLIYFFNASANFTVMAFITIEFSAFVNSAENTILKARDRAEKNEKAKSVFLENMSHEIRTPLNSIIGMINLSIITDDEQEKNRFIHTAKNSADHLLTVINDILDYSKIENISLQINNELFNIRHLVVNTMASMDSSVYGKKLEMKYAISDSVPETACGDHTKIRQSLTNLVSNAIKFTENGAITVSCNNIRHEEGICTLEFSVEDTGIGIPEDKIDTIFKRFTQVDLNETRQFTGTGLGLAISKELIELMGGTISVKSRPGHGTVFTFSIPVQVSSENEEYPVCDKTLSQEKYRSQLNILIAEDIFTNWLLYEKYMQIMGHSFKLVENGFKVLDELEKNCYDLLLLDIEMPGMDGREALEQIRNGKRGNNSKIPVIAMTGYYIGNDKNNCGFDGFLIKPIELDALERKIHEVMPEIQNNGLPGLPSVPEPVQL